MNGYIKVASEECIEITYNYLSEFETKRYGNRFRKVFFFFTHEGARKTIKKITFAGLDRKIEAEQKIIACRINLNGNEYVAIGKQLCNEKHKKFTSKLVFGVRNIQYFKLNSLRFSEKTFSMLAYFIPVHDCPLDKNLPRQIVSENPDLKTLDFKITESHIWRPEKIVADDNSKKIFLYGFGKYVRSYSERFFKGQINSIVDYNKRKWDSYRGTDKPSFIEDFVDSLPSYRVVEQPIGIISTYHSSHFEIAKRLFYSNSNGKVFIEKPLVVRFSDAMELVNLRKKGFWFEVGYNRRYIDWNQEIKCTLQKIQTPKIIDISVTEVPVSSACWYFWQNQGTRITGNICHWIDLAYFWLKCKPLEMTLLNSNDSISLGILFEDGSIVNIIASEEGNSLRGVQEKIEIRTGNTTIFIDDYRKMITYKNGRTKVKRKRLRDKGHDKMYKEFLTATKTNAMPRYENDDILWVAYMTEKASLMLMDGEKYAKLNCRDW